MQPLAVKLPLAWPVGIRSKPNGFAAEEKREKADDGEIIGEMRERPLLGRTSHTHAPFPASINLD